jgi:hypothetical protein
MEEELTEPHYSNAFGNLICLEDFLPAFSKDVAFSI